MKYRKKPVEVEAIQFNYERWVYQRQDAYPTVWGEDKGSGMSAKNPYIKTPRGDLLVFDGDYIAKGADGGFYPCKPDIFDATYEAVM